MILDIEFGLPEVITTCFRIIDPKRAIPKVVNILHATRCQNSKKCAFAASTACVKKLIKVGNKRNRRRLTCDTGVL